MDDSACDLAGGEKVCAGCGRQRRIAMCLSRFDERTGRYVDRTFCADCAREQNQRSARSEVRSGGHPCSCSSVRTKEKPMKTRGICSGCLREKKVKASRRNHGRVLCKRCRRAAKAARRRPADLARAFSLEPMRQSGPQVHPGNNLPTVSYRPYRRRGDDGVPLEITAYVPGNTPHV